MKRTLLNVTSLFIIFGMSLSNAFGQTTTFNYTGAMQTYVVPAGVSSIQIECWGGEGYGTGGEGGYVTGDFTVTPGETLEIYVGGAGGQVNGGFNGGGDAGSYTTYGAGGGASDVRQGGSTLNDRIIVAGGGGGTGSNCGTNSAPGGNGGGLTGETGCNYSCSSCQYTGSGGTQSAGGVAGPTGHSSCGNNTDGSFGQGGPNTGNYGTGGGGGWYGGGSGCYEGAGGGSSYTDPSATNVSHTQGGNTGDGQVIITVLCDGLNTTVSATDVCVGDSVVLHASSINGGTVSWDNGITDSVAFVPSLGTTTYTATSSDANDCDFAVDITVHPLPTVDAGSDINLCTPQDTVLTGSGAVSYTWDNGVTDGATFTPPMGVTTYTVTGTDANGCENTDQVDISVGGPSVTANITHENNGGDGAIDITVTGGSGTYTYSWSNGPSTQDINNLIAGVYSVHIEDGTCSTDTSFTVLDVASIEALNEYGIKMYPNPTSDFFTIEFDGTFTYELSSLEGKVLLKGKAVDKEEISIEEYSSGIYLITLKVDENIVSTLKVRKK